MYADTVSEAMNVAIKETERRRKIQEEYNAKYGIIPKTVIKSIREVISNTTQTDEKPKISKSEKRALMAKVEEEMKRAAAALDFERAVELRDILFELKSEE